ncbi:MAG: UvrD-helicase domain-containing protein [Acidobacteriota bacterium]
MNKWEHIRRAARDFRQKVGDANGLSVDHRPANDLVPLAADLLGLESKGLPAAHPSLHGSLARLEDGTIYFRNDVETWLAAYYQVHEMGHVVLGHGERECSETAIDPDASEARIPFGVHRVEGYGPQERIESEANIFAREFLLPCEVLKKWFVEESLKAEEIAKQSGMGLEMVCHQLAYALLTPAIHDRLAEDDEETNLTLNDSQKSAAHVAEGPQLVDAGPGTGKTRTLVGRALHLISSGVRPENILVLTFSNKAAEELRTRLHRFAPESAGNLNIETFHSFGLELLRKYGTKLGLPEKPEILDPVEAIFLLEGSLPELGLDYYQYLPEPSRYLPDIARAISRAKDENVGPEQYLDLATKQRELATTDEEIEKAERAQEVARVYRIYEEKLAERKVVDLGDLICKSIALLKQPEVQADVRKRHVHVLVDEYQDVNRASGLLLKEIVDDGRNLWAVGDLRQSIHRWRGATTANIRLFKEDFPLAKDPISLEKNYRSRRGIVELFSSFAPKMGAAQGREFNGWEIHNEDAGTPSVRFDVASDPEAEAMGIANEVGALHDSGIRYSEQAVICRTHTGMARVARVIANAGVPVLYMGDLFERPEIRDLLSLLSLAAGPDGAGLVRVARFPEYNIPFDDVRLLIKLCSERSMAFPEALTKTDEIEGLSPDGRPKLRLIATHLTDLTHGRSAWKCLTRYLFERSSYLSFLLEDPSPVGQQQRLAIYQFLQFVHSRLDAPEPDKDSDPKREFLRYVRRLEIFGDEKLLREPDEWATTIDAVRIMTIHASKGLEFKAVFLPGLYKGNMPNSVNRDLCKPPDGLLSESDPNWRDEEEECLFFVAMSRAREKLYLSRPATKSNKNSTPSKFLEMINSSLPSVSRTEATWVDQPESEAVTEFVLPQPPSPVPYRATQLELYIKCPLRYFYQYVLGLSAKREDTAYQQFHRAVYKTIDQLKTARDTGTELTEELVRATFQSEWTERGPTDHFLAGLYEASAERMVGNAVDRMRSSDAAILTDHELDFASGKIKLDFDLAELPAKGPLLIQRFKTGRPTKSEGDKDFYALLLRAANELRAGRDSRVEILYLRDNAAEAVSMTDKVIGNRNAKYEAAMKNITDGHFYPVTGEYDCPRCPYYFNCPAAV